MEELLFSVDVNSGQEYIGAKKEAGRYGHVREIEDVRQRINGIAGKEYLFDDNSDFSKVKTHDKREAEVNKVFTKAAEEMDGHLKFNSENIYDKVKIALTRGKLAETDRQVEFIEKYSETGVLDDLQEVTFERSMAQKCEKADSTKHTRRRKAKREKAFEKQKAALLAAAEMSNKLYHNAKLDERDEQYEQDGAGDYIMKSTKKYALAKRDAQQNYIDAMIEADEYDYENNIKMARTEDGKRVIDMGNGTSDYFASLFKLSSDYKIKNAKKTLVADYINLKNYMSGKEADRIERKGKEFIENDERMKEKLNNDANKCIDRLPDLLIALNPELEVRKNEIRSKVDDLKNKALESKISLVQNIIHNPYIMATFRKDMRELGAKQLPDENKRKELAGDILNDLNKKITADNANGGNVQ